MDRHRSSPVEHGCGAATKRDPGEVCGDTAPVGERRRNLIASATGQEGITMRSSMQRPASPRATAVDHPPAVPRHAAGGDIGWSRKLVAGKAHLNLVTCYLWRGI